jgi:hypothetical protein
MSVADRAPMTTVTEHALLVPLGRFAAAIGLTAALGEVPFKMKTLAHRPGEKLAELLVLILSGGMHVSELSHGPHPVLADPVVAQAWGQDTFASASGVSELLRAASPASVAGLKTVVRDVLGPYRRRILRDLATAWLVVDADLTALVVSDQARTYEGAAFGYAGAVHGGLAKGYQFARAQLVGKRDVFLLGGFLHPGNTLSSACLAELVSSIEAELGRPRRRVELLEQQLVHLKEKGAAVEQTLTRLSSRTGGSPTRRAELSAQRERLGVEYAQLQSRQATLRAENAGNLTPRRILLRLDGGFGNVAHLAWLNEQGYDVIARAHNQKVAQSLRQEAGLRWEHVSRNEWVAESTRTTVGDSPYPLRVFACRQLQADGTTERWSALYVTPSLAPPAWPTRRIGVFYNGRQTIEATTKEGKGVFASRHLPTRHRAGIELYQDLVVLAQNLVRWFRRQILSRTPLATIGIKDLVRIGANSRAQVSTDRTGGVIVFGSDSVWSGVALVLGRVLFYQLSLPFLDALPVRAKP